MTEPAKARAKVPKLSIRTQKKQYRIRAKINEQAEIEYHRLKGIQQHKAMFFMPKPPPPRKERSLYDNLQNNAKVHELREKFVQEMKCYDQGVWTQHKHLYDNLDQEKVKFKREFYKPMRKLIEPKILGLLEEQPSSARKDQYDTLTPIEYYKHYGNGSQTHQLASLNNSLNNSQNNISLDAIQNDSTLSLNHNHNISLLTPNFQRQSGASVTIDHYKPQAPQFMSLTHTPRKDESLENSFRKRSAEKINRTLSSRNHMLKSFNKYEQKFEKNIFNKSIVQDLKRDVIHDKLSNIDPVSPKWSLENSPNNSNNNSMILFGSKKHPIKTRERQKSPDERSSYKPKIKKLIQGLERPKNNFVTRSIIIQKLAKEQGIKKFTNKYIDFVRKEDVRIRSGPVEISKMQKVEHPPPLFVKQPPVRVVKKSNLKNTSSSSFNTVRRNSELDTFTRARPPSVSFKFNENNIYEDRRNSSTSKISRQSNQYEVNSFF